MLFNYSVGMALSTGKAQKLRKLFLISGIAINLGLLGYFKYFNFFVDQMNWLLVTDYHVEKILLPLAISFFTFQQIAYLVDAYRNEAKELNFLNYCLFVTFFPQLIAGPIVHHKEMLPQFAERKTFIFSSENFSIGLTIFALGLFKKVILADGVAIYASPVFLSADTLQVGLTLFEAWGGALAYTLQLYFDFSGYSDMAMGIAMLFGVKLPLNFNSPYRANSIIEFWRRWHMTLSRFLRDYLYFALGGNQKGNVRRYVNLFLTMLLGGIWHGAGWTFIVWGMLHGSYLMVNHAWRKTRRDLLKISVPAGVTERFMGRMLTLLAVIVGWVYFRAETFSGANHMLATMFGLNGISLPSGLSSLLGDSLNSFGVVFNGMFGGSSARMGEGIGWIVALMFVAVLAPNTMQLTAVLESNISKRRVALGFAFIISFCLFASFVSIFEGDSEFLYFNF
jgi:D-alanyl-lipoteichoic acid acyltransferase DltB (MBOAT superfamily)